MALAPRLAILKAEPMSIGTILLIVLVIALLGGFSGIGGAPFYHTYPHKSGLVLCDVFFMQEDQHGRAQQRFMA